MKDPQIKRSVVLQEGITDCGVACLATILKYYSNSNVPLNHLRKLSGTTSTGTTLLGLHDAANKLGLKAEGYQAKGASDLKDLTSPCILHVTIDGKLLHYVVCFGFDKGSFIISDPARGLYNLTEEDIDNIWLSRRLIVVEQGKVEENIGKQNVKAKSFIESISFLWNDYPHILLLSIAIALILGILSIASYILVSYLIDKVLPGNDSLSLIKYLSILAALLLSKNIASYLRQNILISQNKKVNERITGDFFKKIIMLPKYFFDSNKKGDLVSRLNDSIKIHASLSYIYGYLIADIILILLITIFIIGVSGYLGLSLLLLNTAFVFIMTSISKKIVPYQKTVMESYAVNESNYLDTMQGIDTIKVHNRQPLFATLSQHIYSNFQSSVFSFSKVKNRMTLISDFYSTIVTVLIIGGSSYFFLRGTLTMGQMIANIQLSLLIVPSVIQVGLANLQLHEAKLAFTRINQFSSHEPEYTVGSDSKKKGVTNFDSLEIRNLTFAYPGRLPVLNNVSLSIKKGEIIGLKGKSGSGKTTLINILQKFYEVPENSIFVNQTDWNLISIESWRNIIGIVPQDIKIFNGSIASNICLDPKVSDEDIDVVMKKYQLDKYFDHFPHNYQTIIGESGQPISGGQKQLIGIARALMKKPKLLIFDEATSAMDKKFESEILDLVKKIAEQKEVAVIISAHNDEILNNLKKTYDV
ncbi:MAG TPA: cysteine peptidase family C39 domain-containing protein [Chryseosolibacter sp.]|nr:cysteine peptidase family C39 domain-containing protein [Chryseosolibacter sp.]